MFVNLVNLESIEIQSNFIEKGTPYTLQNFSRILQQFPVTLQSLCTDLPIDADCSESMKRIARFTELKKLHINAQRQYKLTISNDTFRSLIGLPITNLTMYSNDIKRIDPLAFYWFPRLEYLDMSRSGGIEIDELSQAWYGLSQTNLKVLNLFEFGQRGRRVNIGASFFKYFHFEKLSELYLDNAGIEGANNWDFLKKLQHLRILSVSWNNLNQSQVKNILNNVKNLPHLESLKLNQQLPAKSSLETKVSFNISLPPNLEMLDISATLAWPSYRRHTLDLTIRKNCSLKQFYFSNNFVDEIDSFILSPNPQIPIELDFSINRLVSSEFLSESAKKGLKIRKLNLGENKLGKGKKETTFNDFPLLEFLDLSSNEIKSLSVNSFVYQKKMRILNLSKNYLWLIEFEFAHMVELEILDLSNNSLTQLDAHTREKFNLLKHDSPKFRLNLRGNPLECSCSGLAFIDWMSEMREMFQEFNRYSCIYNDTMVKFTNFKQIYQQLKYDCSMNLAAKLSAGLLTLVIVITGVSVFLYRHRWDVRFFCIKFVARRNEYVEHEGYRSLFEYDAFVAYHKSDLNWVRSELYENLSIKDDGLDEENGERKFRLCLHDKDFIPGLSIEDNIVRAIENSRKTILVLSKEFLKSGWCEFELQIARMESLDKGRNLIIAVMLEQLKTGYMSKKLRLIINRNTYIEWHEDPTGKIKFWEKMRNALRTDRIF